MSGQIPHRQESGYPAALEALKTERTLQRRVNVRQRKYLNNIVEQDHRTVKVKIEQNQISAAQELEDLRAKH